MRRIWVYQGKLGWRKDFKWMSVAEFKRSFTVEQAVGYLEQIKQTLQQEAKELPREADFYTGIRHAFAEIDGLGKLYCGEKGKGNTVKNTIEFATEYLGRVNDAYCQMFGLLIDMYRHGLAHTHLTKSIRFRGPAKRWITLGWVISDGDSDRHKHLTIERSEKWFCRLWLHVPQFVDDTLAAIDSFCADLRKEGEQSRLFRRFKRGYQGTAAVYEAPSSASHRRGNQGALRLNQYSADGVAWVTKEIATGRAWQK